MNEITQHASEQLPVPTLDVMQELAKKLLQEPQLPAPLTERFAPGVYLRELFMPAGSFVIGHLHKTEHFNIVLQGRCSVVMNGGEFQEITAPHTFVSGAGVMKALYIHEDTIWQTVHPTDETDPVKLRAMLIEEGDFTVEYLAEQRAKFEANFPTLKNS